jgi:CspA family cold shock protein
MMKKALINLMAVSFTGFMVACGGGGESHNVVESGTYEGTVKQVKPDENEIYVKHKDKELELYFTDSTQLMRNGESVAFDKLKKDQQVSVKVEKVGKRLNPLQVKIME